MNVLFLNYHDFSSNSAVHICNLAHELAGMGVDCAVAVPGDPASVAQIGARDVRTLDFRAARNGSLRFGDGRPPTLVHAWTPREAVRELAEELSARHGCPYVVHLEDNEDVITADRLGLTLEQLRLATLEELDASVSATVAHPIRMRRFLSGAAALSVIVERLLEFRPPGVPAEVIWPAFEPMLFTGRPADPELRRRLGIGAGEAVVVYAGNAHASNAAEMRSLYLAVAAVNRAGRPLRLVRLGRDFVSFLERELKAVERFVVRVPLQARSEVPRYLELADVLVQPGRPDEFNDYRFPSKLPEFLASARPVVLPAANLGRHLEDGVECVLLRRGDALEIAAVLERLLAEEELRGRLGRAARAFAERTFSWPASAGKLLRLYERALERASVRLGAGADPRRERPAPGPRRLPARLGYATVRDHADSARRLPELASASRDLKDVQRPWALEAITAALPAGARLLEIGAGEPLVADRLARLGYDVTVLDPYDGRDRGPADLEALRAAYPRVRILRGLFPGDVPREQRVDCVYSISVLEHLPADSLAEACAEMTRLAGGGYLIHAVDHVLLGAGAEDHLARLRLITRALGIPASELERLLARLGDDPDAYFLSAESHNRWRGDTPYDEFPMRRCVSIQLCLPIGAP